MRAFLYLPQPQKEAEGAMQSPGTDHGWSLQLILSALTGEEGAQDAGL